MSVEIEPLELGFRRPFTVEVSQTLRIKNPSKTPVAFKVKTTAPKQYCVRPNSGRVEPGAEVEVQVLLQAMKYEPPMDAKCKDKFLVQSVAITADREFSNMATLQFDGDRSAIVEKKIRVSFLPATSTPNRPSARNNGVSYPSPGEESMMADTTAIEGDEPPSSPEAISHHETEDAVSSISAAPVAAAAAASAALAKATEKPSYEELERRLKEQEKMVSSLKDDSGIRQRKGPSGAAGADAALAGTAVAARQTPQGVSLNVTAILCLICFLLAYFFF